MILLAQRLARTLAQANARIAFAESCTGGLASATLTRIPGVSDVHCGGVVVYRKATKRTLLAINERDLENPGPVSAKVAAAMARNVLLLLPEATIAASMTGFLGPAENDPQDGLVYVGFAIHRDPTRSKSKRPEVMVKRMRVESLVGRYRRQRAVVRFVYETLIDWIGECA